MKKEVANPLSFLDAIKQKHTFVAPCGKKITIQEIDAVDEALLSSEIEDPTEAINRFLNLSVLEIDNKKATENSILKLWSRTRIYILLQLRITSYGPEMLFKHVHADEDEAISYEEDLNKYTWDFTKPDEFPIIVDPESPDIDKPLMINNPNYSSLRCPSYITKEDLITFKLSSGKNVRFQHLSGIGEKKLAKLDDSKRNIHSELLARFIEIQDLEGNWHLLPAFKGFSGRDMMEIRYKVELEDSEFMLISKITHPVSKISETITLIQKFKDFFFPAGV